jgi:transposase-like protein
MNTQNTAFVSLSTDLAKAPSRAAEPPSSTEVVNPPSRRRFTLAYKRKIVAMADGLPPIEVGALLRREGLYSSHLANWRRALAGLEQTSEPRRGRKPDPVRHERLRIEKLERELVRANKRLAQAEAIIEAQKKLCALLGLPSSEEKP